MLMKQLKENLQELEIPFEISDSGCLYIPNRTTPLIGAYLTAKNQWAATQAHQPDNYWDFATYQEYPNDQAFLSDIINFYFEKNNL